MSVLSSNITPRSKELFLEFAKDAGNWNGRPLVDGNVEVSKQDRGNLTQLKILDLLETYSEYDMGRTLIWVKFTDTGKAYAKENGIDIDWAN